ncbi:hypothetical protein ODZ23_10615, partial [Escherichia coli]|nr:hypothetical protein [Escherichia coli]
MRRYLAIACALVSLFTDTIIPWRVDHLLLNDPENPLLDLVCAKITAWEESAPEFAEFNAMAQAMP